MMTTVEPTTGIEPVTPSLPRKCSTTEPRGLNVTGYYLRYWIWSGRRDSDPRPSAWKADALPTELLPPKMLCSQRARVVEREGFEPSKAQGRQVYSLLRLTASLPLQYSAVSIQCQNMSREKRSRPRSPRLPYPTKSPWGWRRDLNPRPADYKSAALPTELRQLANGRF